MNCHDARELFSAWVDDALTPEERRSVASHLAECPECRRELERFEATVTLLHRVERPRAPVGFVDRVLAAAHPVPWHQRLLRRLFVPISVKLPAEAAALLVVTGLAVLFFQRSPELQQATRQETPVEHQTTPASRPDTEGRALLRQMAPTASPPAPARDQGSATAGKPDPRETKAKTSAAPAPEPPSPPAANEVTPTPTPPTVTETPASSGTPAPALKKEAAGGSVALERAAEQPVSAAPPAPATSPRVDSPKDTTDVSPTIAQRSAAARSTLRMLPIPDVVGRLSVKDRAAAERTLAEALGRAGGSVITRREEGATTVVDLAVPAAAYPAFSEELTRIGAWRPERKSADLPSTVHITVSLVE